VDFDEDGKKDIVSGDSPGSVWFFRNKGSDAEPVLEKGVMLEADGKAIKGARRIYEKVDGQYKVKETVPGNSELSEKYSKIDLADWNNDGLLDILMGQTKGEFLVYYNTGEKGKPAFGRPELIKAEAQEHAFPVRPSPHVVDWNRDGKKDLLVGSEDGRVFFYPNTGTDGKPCFAEGIPLKAGGDILDKGSRARLDVVDWNNDGKPDIVLGNFESIEDPGSETGKTYVGRLYLFLGK